MDKLQDAIVLELFLNSLPEVWVQEHKPKTSEAAAQLAPPSPTDRPSRE